MYGGGGCIYTIGGGGRGRARAHSFPTVDHGDHEDRGGHCKLGVARSPNQEYFTGKGLGQEPTPTAYIHQISSGGEYPTAPGQIESRSLPVRKATIAGFLERS